MNFIIIRKNHVINIIIHLLTSFVKFYFLAGAKGLEPLTSLLESGVLPIKLSSYMDIEWQFVSILLFISAKIYNIPKDSTP